MLTREINPEVRVADEKAGLVEYIASDESVDHDREVLRADGWRFDRFQKNAPLVDSHRYGSVACVLGKIVDFRIEGRRLVETAQWAIDVAENEIARLGWAMTKAGYLRAVSVGFDPEVILTMRPMDDWPPDWGAAQVLPAGSRSGKALWQQQIQDLRLNQAGKQPVTIFVRQQQLELSACVIGANANALAKSYKAGVISEADLDLISKEYAKVNAADSTDPAGVEKARQRARTVFRLELEQRIKRV